MTTLKRYAWYALFIIMTLTMSLTSVMAQEEATETQTAGSAGLMIGILAIGILAILALGAAMNAQAKDDAEASE